MKHLYVAAGVVAVLLWTRGQKKADSFNQLQDTLASQKGSDWIGSGGLYALWDRLSGTDLAAPGYSNLNGSAQADPGKVGQIDAGLTAGWDGTLGNPAATIPTYSLLTKSGAA